MSVGGIEVSAGMTPDAVRFILATTVWLEFIVIFATLPATSKTGPAQSSTHQPSCGRTSMMTTIPIAYPASPNGVGLRMNSAAFLGSILISSTGAKNGALVATVGLPVTKNKTSVSNAARITSPCVELV